jgi:hypothetical protein
MGWKIHNEAIEMQQRRFGYFPKVFRWRGHYHVVQSVERCWTATRRPWMRAAARHYFLVICAEGAFELYQDTGTNTWHLRRAKAHSIRLSATWPTYSVQPEGSI